MKAILFFILAMVLGGKAMAQRGEFLYQAGEKQGVLDLDLSLNESNAVTKSDDPIPLKSQFLRLNYEYGFFKNFTAFGGLTYSKSIVEGELEGLGPLRLGAKYLLPMGPGSLFGKLNVDAYVLDGKQSCGGSGCNASDGSIGTSLQLAYQWALNNAFTGVSIEHGLFSSDYKTEDGDSTDKKGFLTLKLFYEREIKDNMWGLVLSYINGGGLAGTNGMFPYVGSGFILDTSSSIETNAWALEGYLRTSLTESFQMVTSLEYSRVLDDKVIGSKSDHLIFGLTFRRLF